MVVSPNTDPYSETDHHKKVKTWSGKTPSIICFRKSNYTVTPRIKPFKEKNKYNKTGH